jgi:von Willebrand factor type A domain
MMMSRLDLAKNIIREGIEKIPGDHAIMSYAREASLENPFSSEKGFLSETLSGLSQVEFYGGSDVMAAISLASRLYGESRSPIRMIIVTDGGSTSSADSVKPLPLFDMTFVGIGTTI